MGFHIRMSTVIFVISINMKLFSIALFSTAGALPAAGRLQGKGETRGPRNGCGGGCVPLSPAGIFPPFFTIFCGFVADFILHVPPDHVPRGRWSRCAGGRSPTLLSEAKDLSSFSYFQRGR